MTPAEELLAAVRNFIRCHDNPGLSPYIRENGRHGGSPYAEMVEAAEGMKQGATFDAPSSMTEVQVVAGGYVIRVNGPTVGGWLDESFDPARQPPRFTIVNLKSAAYVFIERATAEHVAALMQQSEDATVR